MSTKLSPPGQNREQAEKQDFLKWINHLAKLPAIRRVLEIREKNSRPGASCKIRGAAFHRYPPPREAEDFNRFGTSPDCPLLLHPVALST